MSVATAAERNATHASLPKTEAPSRRALRRGLVAGLAAGTVFVLLQGLLAAYNLHVFRAAVAKRLDQLPVTYCLGHCLRQAVPDALFAYAGFALAGVVVAAAGHRLLCALPASLYVLFGLPQSPHAPLPIGQQWQLTCYERCPGPWFGSPWVGAATDLVLVLIPAVLVAWTLRPQRWPGAIDESTVASVGLALGLVVLTYRTAGVVDRPPDIRVACAVAALAVAAGARRPWWPWAHLIAATAFSGYFVWCGRRSSRARSS